MSKITVITDTTGKIVAMAHGHVSQKSARMARSDRPQGGLRAGAGQKLHELDVAADLEHCKSWLELHEKVRPHLKHV